MILSAGRFDTFPSSVSKIGTPKGKIEITVVITQSTSRQIYENKILKKSFRIGKGHQYVAS